MSFANSCTTDAVEDPTSDTAGDTGADVSDVTGDAPAFACGDTLVDSRDGHAYATVLIGTQCWMAQNLDVGTMITGDTAMTDDGVIEKHCYDDDPANCAARGALYQWDEMMDYDPSDAGNPSTTRGICPTGWHVPSDEEFEQAMCELDEALLRLEARAE